jgi:hypothetical protein
LFVQVRRSSTGGVSTTLFYASLPSKNIFLHPETARQIRSVGGIHLSRKQVAGQFEFD